MAEFEFFLEGQVVVGVGGGDGPTFGFFHEFSGDERSLTGLKDALFGVAMTVAVADLISPVRMLRVSARAQLFLLLNLDDWIKEGLLLRLLLPTDDSFVQIGVRLVV